VLVLEWTGAVCADAARPATPAARRLAARHDATPSGRLARRVLGAGEPEAAAAALAVLTPADAPVVLVAAGPRGEAMDDLIAAQGAVLLAARPGDELAPLAAERLGARLVRLGASPGAAALARSGTALVAPLRAAFLEAL
jgi:hypothetical protein